MKIHKNRFDFSFNHGDRVVTMVCNESQEKAKEAFQKAYGYWPENAVWVKRYVS